MEAPTTAPYTQSPAGLNIFGVDPQLGSLANHGGPTQTRLPSLSSPLLDAGVGNGLTTDQRGFPRTGDIPGTTNPSGADGTDIGAVELRVPLAPTIESGPSGPTDDATPTFTFTGTGAASFECRVDGGTYSTCASPFTAAPLTDGAHTFDVHAISPDDVLGPTASRSFTVDTTTPAPPDTMVTGAEVTGDSPQAQGGRGVEVTLGASASEVANFFATGTVKIGRKGRKIALKRQDGEITGGAAAPLSMTPRNPHAAKRILRAVADEKTVVATVRVKFADQANNETVVTKTVDLID